ncbi:MAG: 30S ribosomal protein S5 [Patescibacteria group bacterium]
MAIQKQATTTESTERPSKNFMRPKRFDGDRRELSEFEERVIEVRRVARTVKGGRRIRFRALVVIGNRKGKVGMGVAKANDVSEAVKKAVTRAKRSLVVIPIIDGTIPYEITAKYGSAVVMLRPAASGTSIVAGGSVRAVADLAGISDLLSKMLGSANKVNNVLATLKALSSFNPEYTKTVQKYADKKTAVKVTEAPVEEAPAVETKEEIKAVKSKAAVKKAAKKK